MVSNFKESLAVGQEFESRIIELTGGTAVDLYHQSLGIDIQIEDLQIDLECKHDKRAATTNNFYAELTTGQKPGCLFTSLADFIILKIGEDDSQYWVFKPRDFLIAYTTVFSRLNLKTVSCINPNGYSSTGMLIPVKKLTQFAKLIQAENLLGYLKAVSTPTYF